MFGTALDVTVAELAIETFHPADDATAAACAREFGNLLPSPRHED